ncbi:amino acid adenylation domain-containing protein [Saccharopolyspora spinosa]|uniref:Nonribosomal peptide synthetase DhbF n=1 Tax=Saccharopolyspora spinosa TaxID=60894 RepID=A0A2N3Y053_SACSN|nr:amino acid adenylation domain-containing protein [Saccharopolyspora spinosa]PKW16298.1 nonribosomal peptide synthetase DhbF [Saccharopolyspora spinosa]
MPAASTDGRATAHLIGVTSLPDLFTRVARNQKDAVAITDGGNAHTYGSLESAANGLAHHLVASGVKPGDLVGVLIDGTLNVPVALLAILKAGAAYVPFDPSYPADRLNYMVADARVGIIVGNPGTAADIGLSDVRTIDAAQVATTEVAAPEVELREHSPAYVIYTSGSTGRPKGCVVSHGNVLSLLRGTLPLFEFSADDRWTVFHSFSFDFSVWELWGALATGATAVLVPARTAAAHDDFLRLLMQEKITVLNQVPSCFRSIALSHADAGWPALSLRYLTFGGENVDLDVVREFVDGQTGPKPVVANMYGVTEATVFATAKFIRDEDLDGRVASPIGVGLPHLGVHVCDSQLRPVPKGVAGEICITGGGVALGYLNQPSLTAEKFVHVGAKAERCYRTGDLAKVLPNGELEYLGRADQQVKLRGYRIELREIEETIRRHRSARDAAVTVVTTRNGAELIAAYVVPADSADGIDPDLRRYLRDQLPRQMVPARFYLLDGLPLSPSGKLDRQALADLAQDHRPAKGAPKPPDAAR